MRRRAADRDGGAPARTAPAPGRVSKAEPDEEAPHAKVDPAGHAPGRRRGRGRRARGVLRRGRRRVPRAVRLRPRPRRRRTVLGPAAGTKMAPGLYDLEDGTVVAVGTVEYRDLEGGFWAVIGGTEAEGDAGKIVAVIANGDEFADRVPGQRGPLVRGLRRAGRRRVDQDGRPGDHRDARRARRRGRAGGVAPGGRRRGRDALGRAPPDSTSRIRWRRRRAGTTLSAMDATPQRVRRPDAGRTTAPARGDAHRAARARPQLRRAVLRAR